MKRSKRKTTSPYARESRKSTKNKEAESETQTVPRGSNSEEAQQEEVTATNLHNVPSTHQVPPQVERMNIQGINNVQPEINFQGSCSPLMSITDELGFHVDQSLKEKIWNGEFIQLEKLIEYDHAQDSEQVLSVKDGNLVFKPRQAEKKILNIETWTNAFLIFASIYISRHHEEAKSLLKYINMIRVGASRQSTLGWKAYDQQFRIRKSLDPSKKWDMIDAELYMLHMQQANPHVNTSITNRNIRDQNVFHNGPPPGSHGGKCYDFNYKGQCTRYICTYLHSCMRCNNAHPMVHCQTNVGYSGTPRYNMMVGTPRHRGPSFNTQNRMPNPNVRIGSGALLPGRPFRGPQTVRHMGPRKFPY